ncbi:MULTISPECIES: hypothetical protein [Streptomyces]|uniref:Uncharacterized protein n=1 Tax=Streptomyces sviceus (strain ATCC 29083 / DSM 924 / JCM 4929 / NBRC 13980 / NCIMB 11184 / NRRL 5439 / UC 5370) TaxID=463191 RepID=B5HSD5_STRX2|nr:MULTISPECIES: hypothetical protein [Streptomyces]EDY55740.1 conserved hypothetical protein [Streptomyces sviceus ATCC 29083]MYT10810.1 hypothetical protein [Streptomyces sp. SID5470]
MSRRRAEQRRDDDPRRTHMRLQYKSLVVPLQFYLFVKCAALHLDPRKVADEAWILAFSEPHSLRSYRALRERADSIVQERIDAGVDPRDADYSLVQAFDTYFKGKYLVLREGLHALDQLPLDDRRAYQAKLLDLLANENVAAVMGAAVFENREREREKLANLAEANHDLSVLESFFADVRGKR